MESISSVLYQEKMLIAQGQGQGTNPKVEDEGFAAMLAMLLGLVNPSGNELLQTCLTTETVGDGLSQQLNPEKNSVINLMTTINPEFQSKQQTAGDAVLFNNQMSNPALENSGIHSSDENFLQLSSVTDELVLLQQITEDNGAKTKNSSENLFAEQLVVLPDSLAKERFSKEGNMTNLTNFNEQSKYSGNGEEINNIHEGIIEQNNQVLTREELLAKAFVVNEKGYAENFVKDFTVKAEQLPQELPELVMWKLKTFEHKDGSKDIVIHLEPKELGKLVVKLSSQEGIVSVKFMANYPVTRDLLESSLNNLRQSFSEQGIAFDRLDVELGGQQLNQSQSQQQQQQWDERLGKANTTMSSGTDAEGYYENFEPEKEQHVLLKTGTYDYLV
jgi:flagellar hook-length control protein FliK